jgi:cyanophycinase-like exopeptidase
MRLILLLVLLTIKIQCQVTYTSYFTGDTSNVNPLTAYGICLMGGASEDDNAMKWFLNRSGGGDVVVIRTTGSNGYNNYLYSTLGISLNSVETLVIPSIAAANHPYVRRRLREAEAVFIAGGNQWDYISFWKNTAVDSALNYLINIKKVPIGGTSAGMAIQGQAYYSASVGSVISSVALSNPYGNSVTIGNNDFLKHKLLKRVITDTHYDNPDRKGRHSTFLARLFQDSNAVFYGIACDEYTAVCIDSSGIAKVYGGFPTYDDNAYFIIPNCVLPNTPENCSSGQALNWVRNNQALKVYQIKGTTLGAGNVNIVNWQNFAGGNWQNWWINNGVLSSATTSLGLNCNTTQVPHFFYNEETPIAYPNPAQNELQFSELVDQLSIVDANGKIVLQKSNVNVLDISTLSKGFYAISIRNSGKTSVQKFVKD